MASLQMVDPRAFAMVAYVETRSLGEQVQFQRGLAISFRFLSWQVDLGGLMVSDEASLLPEREREEGILASIQGQIATCEALCRTWAIARFQVSRHPVVSILARSIPWTVWCRLRERRVSRHVLVWIRRTTSRSFGQIGRFSIIWDGFGWFGIILLMILDDFGRVLLESVLLCPLQEEKPTFSAHPARLGCLHMLQCLRICGIKSLLWLVIWDHFVCI